MLWIQVSFGARSALRHYFLKEGIEFKEDKGWLTSRFYFKEVTELQARELNEWISKLQGKQE